MESVGVDEIHWGRGLRADNFMTVIYQIDAQCRRLLWVGKRRSEATLRRGLKTLGPEVIHGLRFVCSDMWKPYLNVIAAEVGQALHVLDRFHITTHLSGGGRGAPEGEFAATGSGEGDGAAAQAYALAVVAPGQSGTRASPAKAGGAVGQQAGHGPGLGVEGNLRPSVLWAGAFLDYWCFRAMRSRLEPMKKVARMLRAHEELLLNWFRAKGEISTGAVEGLNNKIRVVTRRSYGFRTYDAMELALYHTLGRLPEPESAHKFC